MTHLSFSVPDDLGEWAQAPAAEARLQAAIDEGLASPEVDTTTEDIIAESQRRRAAA